MWIWIGQGLFSAIKTDMTVISLPLISITFNHLCFISSDSWGETRNRGEREWHAAEGLRLESNMGHCGTDCFQTCNMHTWYAPSNCLQWHIRDESTVANLDGVHDLQTIYPCLNVLCVHWGCSHSWGFSHLLFHVLSSPRQMQCLLTRSPLEIKIVL